MIVIRPFLRYNSFKQEVFPMSCHNIGHGLNEVVRKVLIEYDADSQLRVPL